ncbi:MAG: hypothetical protein HKN76_14780 [Saprospiraceae bacterium]|nr:hypothetical protein [Saprospiraceae bacterium]
MIERKTIKQSQLTSANSGRLLKVSCITFRKRLLVQCCMMLLVTLVFTATSYGQIPSPIVSFEGHSGILIPRLGTEAIATIPNPVDGLLVYDTDLNHFCFYSSKSASWRRLSVVENPVVIDSETKISGAREINLAPHEPSFQSEWNVQGNIGANNYSDDPPLMGTTDAFPVVFITDDQERMRILADGNITIVRSVEIGEDLTVKQNVDLNTVGGETNNNGPFTVTNESPTLLSGKLTVDKKTQLNLGLEVFGSTTLHGNFTVANNFPSLLTGQTTISDLTQSDSAQTSDGALVVAGGTGIGKNLNVGGDLAIKGSAAFGGPVNFASPVTISAQEESTGTNDGALIVAGGVGIGKRLNVGGATALASTLDVTGDFRINTDKFTTLAASGNTSIAGTLGVMGNFAVNTNKFNVDASNGNTLIAGTLGVTGATTLNNTLNLTATVSKPSGANPLTQPSHHIANFVNTADGNGISIKVGAATPHNNNNFITFYNNGGGTVGRIEGEDGDADYGRNREYQDALAFAAVDIAFATLDIVIAGLESLQAGVDFGAALGSSTACAGLGVCVTAPIPSLIISGALNVILKIANAVSLGGNLASAIANQVVTVNTHEALKGITFASGAEDYAEYLPKLDPNEFFSPGDIVAVKNGHITKDTRNADMVMLISFNPAVLGGLPAEEDVAKFEKVAFMGQVPTKVLGEVKPGDYILPSGFHNGTGIAKSPDQMKPEDYQKIVGVSWAAQDKDSVGFVKTAIGLNTNDIAHFVQKQAEKIEDLEGQLISINENLARLVPGYAEATNSNVRYDDHEGHDHEPIETSPSSEGIYDSYLTQATAEQIVYTPVERKHLDEAFALAEELSVKAYNEAGLDINDHPFWKRIYSEPGYKEEVFAEIKEEIKHSMHIHQKVDRNILQKGH